MATLDTTAQLTLLELAKRRDPNGELADIAAVLSKDNPILQMMPWVEANGATFHKVVRQGKLRSGNWRRINEYLTPGANQTGTANEVMGMLEDYNQVDVALAELSGNVSKFRMDEAMMTIEGMGQTLATAFFYADNSKDSDQFTGLAPRLATLQTGSNRYVIGNGGTGSDLTSVYVVMPDPMRTFMIYPKGGVPGGIKRTDKGQVTDINSSGNKMEVYRDHFKVTPGLAVKDTRTIGRVANIEARSVGANGFDEDNLIELINWMPEGQKIICVNKEVATQMQIAAKDKNNVYYSPNTNITLSGELQTNFNGYPIVRCEAITSTETAIT